MRNDQLHIGGMNPRQRLLFLHREMRPDLNYGFYIGLRAPDQDFLFVHLSMNQEKNVSIIRS